MQQLTIEQAFANIKQIFDGAVKGGLFPDTTSVAGAHATLVFLEQTLKEYQALKAEKDASAEDAKEKK